MTIVHKVKYKDREICINEGCKNDNQISKLSKILSVEDYESHLGKFDIVFCKKCKLGFTSPYPTEDTAHLLYETKNSSDFDGPSRSFIDAIKDRLCVLTIKKITSGIEVNAVLDYSTGNGRFALGALHTFKNATVHAVDFQYEPPIALAIEKKVTYFTNLEFENTDDKYDLIILRHVLEHTFDPVALIKVLGQRLSNHGILYIEVPNLDSGCARIFKKYWKLYYAPRHILHFTKTSLMQAINLGGLECDVRGNEVPMMGNTFAIITGFNQSSAWVKVVGIFLHPIQILIEILFNSSTCINAVCFKSNDA